MTMDKAAPVLCVGRNSVDICLNVDLALLRADSKQRSGPAATTVGGQCVNAAVTLAGLGARVFYAGVIGEAEGGEDVTAFLGKRGVDYGLCYFAPDLPNASAYVLVDGATGERTIVEAAPSPYPTLGEITLPSPCAYVYFDGNEFPASLTIAEQARRAGIPTLMDMEVLTDDTRALLRRVDTAIVPQPVAAEIAQSVDPHHMLTALADFGPSRVAITQGEEGAIGLDAAKNMCAVSAVPCTAVDTTGAGDAFHAGFLFADSMGVAFGEALQFGAQVASLKCETPGPSTGAAPLAELARRLPR